MNNGRFIYKLIPADSTKEEIILTGASAVAEFLQSNRTKISQILNHDIPLNGYKILKEGIHLDKVNKPSTKNIERANPRNNFLTKDNWRLKIMFPDKPTLAVIKTFKIPSKYIIDWDNMDKQVRKKIKDYVKANKSLEDKHMVYTSKPEITVKIVKNHLYEIQFFIKFKENKNIKEKYEDIKELCLILNNEINKYENNA